MKIENIPADIKSKSLKEARDEIDVILRKLENLISFFTVRLILNTHINTKQYTKQETKAKKKKKKKKKNACCFFLEKSRSVNLLLKT